MSHPWTTETFIAKITEIYGDKFDLSRTEYKNNRSPVTLICKTHGLFERNARSLITGTGCPHCKDKWLKYVSRQRDTTEDFVSKANAKHNGYYTYTKSMYVNSRSLITIDCPIHGEFQQQAGGHLEGYGCRKCGNKKHGDYRPWLVDTYFERFPEKRKQPATLYLLYSADEDFYKVGITTKLTVEERVKYMSHYEFIVVDQLATTYYNAWYEEQRILKEYKQFKYKPTKRFGGWGECLRYPVNIRDSKIHRPLDKGIKEESCGQ